MNNTILPLSHKFEDNVQENENENVERPKRKRKSKIWNDELSQKFFSAVETLGGPSSATPKKIIALMGTDSVSYINIANRLHKLRHPEKRIFRGKENRPSFYREANESRTLPRNVLSPIQDPRILENVQETLHSRNPVPASPMQMNTDLLHPANSFNNVYASGQCNDVFAQRHYEEAVTQSAGISQQQWAPLNYNHVDGQRVRHMQQQQHPFPVVTSRYQHSLQNKNQLLPSWARDSSISESNNFTYAGGLNDTNCSNIFGGTNSLPFGNADSDVITEKMASGNISSATYANSLPLRNADSDVITGNISSATYDNNHRIKLYGQHEFNGADGRRSVQSDCIFDNVGNNYFRVEQIPLASLGAFQNFLYSGDFPVSNMQDLNMADFGEAGVAEEEVVSPLLPQTNCIAHIGNTDKTPPEVGSSSSSNNHPNNNANDPNMGIKLGFWDFD